MQEAGVERLGFEQDHVTYSMYRQLEEGLQVELVPVRNLVENLRRVKNATEIEHMQAATNIAEAAWLEILPTIKVGQTEKEVALRLRWLCDAKELNAWLFPLLQPRGSFFLAAWSTH